MTTETDHIEHRKPATAEQVQNFITAKGIEKDCHDCGKNEWSIHAEEVGANMLAARGRQTHVDGTRYFATYSLHCMNCGVVKFLMADVVEEWASENG
ncbi:hypothetical protein [Pelagibacterium mangrovi]|uniref:hypothetical protein n=1 Tax=Pelagibacterium mangrovi TaxID=3119828 RepID=UPI002FC64FB2